MSFKINITVIFQVNLASNPQEWRTVRVSTEEDGVDAIGISVGETSGGELRELSGIACYKPGDCLVNQLNIPIKPCEYTINQENS